MLKRSWSGVLGLAVWLSLFVPYSQSAQSAPQSLPENGTAPVLSEEEMIAILKNLNMPEARVLSIRTSPINGLWEAAIENKGQRFVIYVDSSKRYISPGPFIDYAIHKDITRERIDELNRDRRIDLSKVPLQDALVVGKGDARLKVVVFTDPG